MTLPSQPDIAAGSHSRPATWRRLLVVWVTLFVLVDLVVVAEIALRLRARASRQEMVESQKANVFVQGADNALHRDLWAKRWHSYKPNARLDLTAENGTRFLVSINSRGFRTPEFDIPKPPGTLRIACIGASTTVQGRRDNETYPALLEAALRERFPDVPLEVLNLGVSGTLSSHWLSSLDRLDSFEPDIVLQYNGANDIVQTYFSTYAVEHPLKSALYARSHLANRLVPLAPQDFESGFEATLANFAAINRHVRDRGGIYIGSTFAAPDHDAADYETRQSLDYATGLWTKGRVLRYRQYQRLLNTLNERIRSQSEDEGIPLVDLAASLTEPKLFTDLCHMRPKGIERMARGFLPQVSAAVELRSGVRATAP